ncbi:MAG: 3-isopropylmalate dehydratase small subunit [Saccharofermentanales bacterium]
MKARGKVFKYGANVDTDVIIPARYLNQSDPAELARHCMEDIDADFVKKVQKGDLIVSGPNFGCGSSREHAPVAIKTSGISCVIAPSFARIFYRNSINIGLPIMESKEASEGISAGDEVEADFDTGIITNISTGKSWQALPFPDFIKKIIEKDGLLGYIADKVQ